MTLRSKEFEMKNHFSTRVVASLLAANTILFSGMSAPQSQALTVKEANPQSCTTELDARDIGLFTQVSHDANVAAADFFLFNAGALGLTFTQYDRDNLLLNLDHTAADYINGYSGYDTNQAIRETFSRYVSDSRVRDGMLQTMAGAFYGHLDDVLYAGPGRLGVTPNAFALTFGRYFSLYLDMNQDPTIEQLRNLAALIRKVDVDTTAVRLAANLDLRRATLDGCGAVTGINNADLSNDMADSIRALSLAPGQFYNVKVVRFP
ncbi:MAG: hypothetical protein Q3962_09575, partial [Corynebacterium sp.]|nr:hypothetical protein [Corynebacterium sp.]